MKDEAKAAYEKLVNAYGFGQCWDPQGWFPKQTETAKEKLGYQRFSKCSGFWRCSLLQRWGYQKAWKPLSDKNQEAVDAYVGKPLDLYADKAQEMQKSLTEYAWESKEKIFSYWALNDVGTALLLREFYRNAGNNEEA